MNFIPLDLSFCCFQIYCFDFIYFNLNLHKKMYPHKHAQHTYKHIFCGKPKQTFSFLLVPTCTHDWWTHFFWGGGPKNCHTTLRNTAHSRRHINKRYQTAQNARSQKCNGKWRHSSVQKKGNPMNNLHTHYTHAQNYCRTFSWSWLTAFFQRHIVL